MNTPTLLGSLLKDFNTSIIINQSWFIPIDILVLTCIILAFLISLLFLCIVLTDKTCHTIPMILVTNSCFAGFIFSLLLFWVSFFTLYNDLQQIYYQDLFCNFRGYMCYVIAFALIYSYFLQAIHSYLIVIYPTRLFWQSTKFQFFLIILTWMAAFIFACPYIITNAIIYYVDDQICQLPLNLSFLAVYNVFCIYIIPINGIVFIYLKLIRYVREMNKRVTLANTLLRAKKQLKMVFRIGIIISVFLILGVPYTIFVFMGFIASPPKYHFRIAVTFIEISTVFVMITLFKFTDPVRTSIMKRISRRPNVVAATII